MTETPVASSISFGILMEDCPLPDAEHVVSIETRGQRRDTAGRVR